VWKDDGELLISWFQVRVLAGAPFLLRVPRVPRQGQNHCEGPLPRRCNVVNALSAPPRQRHTSRVHDGWSYARPVAPGQAPGYASDCCRSIVASFVVMLLPPISPVVRFFGWEKSCFYPCRVRMRHRPVRHIFAGSLSRTAWLGEGVPKHAANGCQNVPALPHRWRQCSRAVVQRHRRRPNADRSGVFRPWDVASLTSVDGRDVLSVALLFL
jgi:hypothetical protein